MFRFQIFFGVLSLVSIMLTACNPMGKIEVTDIVNPDNIEPTITFITAPSAMNGAQDFPFEFEVSDNISGSGINKASLYYSPDGINLPFVEISQFTAGRRTINFCPPNKNHPLPTFKIIAKDRNQNVGEKMIGLTPGLNFSINVTEPALPTITSSVGLATKDPSAEIVINACQQTACSGSALYYEAPTVENFISVAAAQPAAGDPSWISCEDVLDDNYSLPAFAGDGNFTYKLWVKSADTEVDGTTALNTITTTSRDITIYHDGTAPATNYVTAAAAMTSHSDFAVSFNLADVGSGLDTAKLFYTPDSGSLGTYPYREIAVLSGGAPEAINFCTPNKTHPNGTFKIEATDQLGNAVSLTRSGFTITKTANALLPAVTSISTASPYSTNTTKVYIDACKQNVCTAGAKLYEAADNNIYIAVKNTQPAAGDAAWVSCSDVLTNGYTFTIPVQVGAGTYGSALWVKSAGVDIDGTTPVATVSTTSVPLTIPYDYASPALTGLNLGNLGTNKDLEILGSSLLTGYSQGSFKLNPSCIDPSSIPGVQTYIVGTVSVSANNMTVTGTGTSFTTEFSPYDYTEINGIYTQIKTITSNTQMTLNEIPGNTPGLVGSGFTASKKMAAYGGVKVTKGAGAPPLASVSGWQPCDSVNHSILYGNLINGANNLQFWIKDRGDNVSTSFLPFAVTYNAPIISVVNGPTVSTVIADMTINACGGGTKITQVLFNETGTIPVAGDSSWQTCSTVAGALKSPSLAPGNHVLKAFFKYTDGFISENPVNVPVNYLPQVAWVESPRTIRPQTTYTLASCSGVDEVFLNQGVAPLAADIGWQPCSTVAGAVSFDLPTTGPQTVNVWYKSGTTVSPNFSQVTVDFVPPAASIFDGAIVSTTQPPLSVDTCQGITKIFIKVDDSSPVAPLPADFAGAGGINCTTALNGITPPAVVGEGNHTYDVWFQFSDGYILDPWYSRVGITYVTPDSSPPPVTIGDGADTPLSLFLVNGDGDGSVPGVAETIENNGSRAHFTLNTCEPMTTTALTGTVSVTAGTTIVTGTGTLFQAELSANSYIKIGTQELKIKSIESQTSLTLILNHSAGASGVAAQKVYPNDKITGMLLTTSAAVPSGSSAYWLSCDNSAEALKTPSLTDGAHTLYAWFKDASNNVTQVPITKQVVINSAVDVTPPPRPPVIVEGAPTLTVAPAKLTVTSCADVDQVYVETSAYPNPYVAPDKGLAGWQNCSTAIGSITYNLNLAGSYTVSVWFKDAAGNINSTPRDVAFIFEPAMGNLPNPIAYWTMDKTHLLKNRAIDAKGNSHLYRWDPDQVVMVTGRDKEGLDLSGTNSYLFTENTSVLKPSIAVTLSMWAYLTKNDVGTKGLAGNGSYGLKLQGGNLSFYASGEANIVSVPTSSYETGWRHIIGTSDGRYVKFFIDGQQVSSTFDIGTPANLVYGSSQLFVVGGLTNGASSNPLNSGFFDDKLDEVVVWDKFFTDQMAMDHFIDAFNKYKVQQDVIPSANLAAATYYGEFLQNALITIPNCGDAKFVYINETTHPPVVDSVDWQLCNSTTAGIIHPNLSQGDHELKIWTKDEYDNISTSYLKIDTVITGVTYQEPGVLYYTLDNVHNNLSALFDIFSGQTALNVGADVNQAAIQNEGYLFVRASSDFIERKYAFNAQPKAELSVSIWANLTASDSREQVLAGTRTTNHGYSVEINQANNELRFNVETSGGLRYAAIPVSAYASGLHNIIGTYDGRYVKIYLDGIELDDRDYTSTLTVQYSCLGSFIVGAGSSCNTGPVAGTHFDNVLDEVLVWDSALSGATINELFNGQDSVAPLAVPVTPKNNQYTIGIPIAKLNVSDCTDIASVYVTLGSSPPLPDIANWQACSTSGDSIKSPLLESGSNDIKVWFKDMAGNVSATNTTVTMNFVYDFTIPEPDSYWPLDNVNVDGAVGYDVTSDRNGTINGSSSVTGVSEEGRTFDGVDDFIEVPFNSAFQPLNEVTLSIWMNAPSYGPSERYLIGNENNGGYALVLNNNNIEFRVMVDGVLEKIITPTAGLNVNEWHHVAGVYNNGVLRLFVNGAEILPAITAASPNTNVTYNNSNSFVIGAKAPAASGNAGSFFTGNLDEPGFWDAALSDTVITEIYNRGTQGDQIYYDVTPPEIPINLNINYYNSLVSRANLTVNSCTGLDYMIVTKDEFPPDKNDEDWQLCNTLVGGLLSKELDPSDSFGKLWTKDVFGNISRNFEYVPITTLYDKPISRPVVHWTFDNAHYIPGTRKAFDRLSQINLQSDTLKDTDPHLCTYTQGLDTATGTVLTNQAGVLNQSFRVQNNQYPSILRANHPENMKLKPSSKLSVAAWVYIVGNTTYDDKHIVSNLYNGKGWALRLHAVNVDDRGLRFTVITNQGTVEPYLETKNIVTGWHLVTGTFDGQKASLFMDGIFVKSFNLPAPGNIIYETNLNTFVGSQASTGNIPTRGITHLADTMCNSSSPANSYYTEKIDEIIVWDDALSKLEVSSLYHNGADILYVADTIPPTLPTLALENTRPDMFADKAYFSLSTCNFAGPLSNVISGVLVNEGTMPDKQDERWESCRTRLGSFGLENLTPGGHTITTWFKDLAGNVTPVSGDITVSYNQGAYPSANAAWPLDTTHNISKYTRDTIDNKVHDLQMVNIETPLNPSAQQVAGKVNEGIDLAATSGTNGAFLSATSTKLLRPVNFLSVGGWFYLNSGDGAGRVLIDHHKSTGATTRGGYTLYMNSGWLRFATELDIAGTIDIAVPMGSITTGWHHVVGIFTGWYLKIYIDGVEATSTSLLAERDFVRYDITTDFRVGAQSDNNVLPGSFFDEKVDELALWGYDLTPQKVVDAMNAASTNEHIYLPLQAPSNVENAFIYHYDNFGSRARMTILDCTNTPYIYITEQSAAVPSPDDPDWRSCQTMPGAILSSKLDLGTTYVDVYAKNSDGLVSTIAGRKEILPVAFDYDLVLPITYFSYNAGHANANENDFIINNTAARNGAPVRGSNNDGDHFTLTAGQNLDAGTHKIYDLREGLSLGLWVDITQGDGATKSIVTRNGSANSEDTAIKLDQGFLKFIVNVSMVTNYNRSTIMVDARYPTSLITTGRHFVSATYDGYDLKLYLDAILVATTNVGYRNYNPTVKRIIDMDGIGGFRVGNGINGKVDEFMVFDRVLNEKEIISWYRRYIDAINPNDTTPPALARNLSVLGSAFGGNWPTDSSDPLYSIDDCTDISGVFVSASAIPPLVDDNGWQACRTNEAYLQGPTLTAGMNNLYFYYRDANGNVSPAQNMDVVYTVPPRPDPVAYWNMDNDSNMGEKIYEPVNQLHAHTYGIIPADYVAGPVGKGIKLDGLRKYLEIEHSPIIKPEDELSVSFWINTPHSINSILGNRGSTAEGYMFRWNCDPPTFPFNGNLPSSQSGGGCSAGTQFLEFILNVDGVDVMIDFPMNQISSFPAHIIGTFDGRYMKIYSNGTLSRKKDLGYKGSIYYSPTSNMSLIIGARAGSSQQPTGYYNNNIIDEVAIYNRALYANQVTDIYNNFIQTGTRIYDPGLALITPPNARTTIYEPYKKSFGSRLKLTISDCTDMNMVLVNDSLTQPSPTDENWQICNTMAGGILSAPMTDNSTVTPRVWAKTFVGVVSAASGTANGETYTLPDYVMDIPRPKVIWSMDSTFAGATSGLNIKEFLSDAHGVLAVPGTPVATVIQINGTMSVAAATDTVTGAATSFTTQLVEGDRIKIGNETVQVKTITDDTNLILEYDHLAGATNSVAYRIGSYNAARSAIEGGFDFDGVQTSISMKPTAATNPMYDLSISAWVQLKRGETQNRHIVGNNQYFTNPDGGGSGLRVKDGQLQFYVTAWTGSTRPTFVVGVDTNIYLNGLHHVTGTYDGRDLNLYIDGVFVQQFSIPFFGASRYELMHDDYSYWTIGAETDLLSATTPGTFYDGVIDEVNIWHKSLTEQQIYYAYEYGSSYLPTAVPDGIPPTDPGIFIANGLTTTASPWINFTTPSCTGANGLEINAIYVGLDTNPVPAEDDLGWQYCTLDAGYVISALLDRGTSTLNVYFRDEEGDVSPPTQFVVNYNPPTLIQPNAYYTFNDADRSGNFFLYDKAGTKHIRAGSSGNSPIIAGKVDKGWKSGSLTGDSTLIDLTHRGEYEVTRDFTTAFWYYSDLSTSTEFTMINQGQYSVSRTASDNVKVNAAGTSKQSAKRIPPQKWTHISVTRIGSSLKIYINGRLDSSHLVSSANNGFNGSKLVLADMDGRYDEMVMYDSGLTPEQVAYLYFKGEKAEGIDVFIPNLVVAKTPKYYWDFDNVQFSDPYLNSKTTSLPMKRVNTVADGQTGANARVGESFFFQRYEDVINTGPETQNTIGRHQYLESDTAAPLALGANFTMSMWVKQPVPRGYYNAGSHTDQTAVVDMWASDAINQAFHLGYTRGVPGAMDPTRYSFTMRMGGFNYGLNTTNDNMSGTDWSHLVIRRKGYILNFYVNGIESDSITLPSLDPVDIPSLTKLRFGESSLYSYYNIPGTVTVGAGSTTVTGTGTQFLTDLFIQKSGTVTIAPGTTAVVGSGTFFGSQFTVGSMAKINGVIHKIASISNNTNMVLTTPHVAGASGDTIQSTNTIRIGLESFTVADIASDTQLTLSVAHVAGVTNEYLGSNINIGAGANDEYAFNGYLDEFAIWDTALTQRQIYNLTLKGAAGEAIPVEPVANLVAENSSSTVRLQEVICV